MNCHHAGSEQIIAALSFDWSTLLLMAGISLWASPHCVIMCGPTLLTVSSTKRGAIHYNLARLTGYTIAGGICGYLGSTLSNYSFESLFGVIGILTILYAGWRIYQYRRISKSSHISSAAKCAACPTCNSNSKHKATSAYPMITGLLTFLLPCASLSPALIAAAGTLSVTKGMLLLAFFWLGTMPAMTGGGILWSKLLNRWSMTRLKLMQPVLLLFLGTVLTIRFMF